MFDFHSSRPFNLSILLVSSSSSPTLAQVPDLTANDLLLGSDVNTILLAIIELGVGVLSACLPAYKPLYNYYVRNKAAAESTTALTKAYEQRSGHRSVKLGPMGTMKKKWSDHEGVRNSEDEERLYVRLGNVANAQGTGDNVHQKDNGTTGILVTRHFNTSTQG